MGLPVKALENKSKLWIAHITALTAKLDSFTESTSRSSFSGNFKYKLKQAYLTLQGYSRAHPQSECWLGGDTDRFAISVLGGVSHKAIEPLLITQKRCIRMIFGDTETYHDKFKTSARCRPIHCTIIGHKATFQNSTKPHIKPCATCTKTKRKDEENIRPLQCQILGQEFYAKESTKPIFKQCQLLTVHNLYRLRTITELFKIMKYRLPIAIYSLITRSSRKDNRLIPPKPSQNFVYKSSWLWNKFLETESGLDFSSTSCNSLKARLNQSLVNAQNRHSTDWHNDNFTEFGSIKPWSTIIQQPIICMSVHDPVPIPILFVSLSLPPSPYHPNTSQSSVPFIFCPVPFPSRPILVTVPFPSHSRLVPTLRPVPGPVPVSVPLVKLLTLLDDIFNHQTTE